jgi:hypothetical protein
LVYQVRSCKDRLCEIFFRMNSFERRLNAAPHFIIEDILEYYRDYTESPSEFPNIFAPLLAAQDLPVVTFDLLPEEILEFYIFPYFNLHYWMCKLICVCKKMEAHLRIVYPPEAIIFQTTFKSRVTSSNGDNKEM